MDERGWGAAPKLLLCLISPSPRRHYRCPQLHCWDWWMTSALSKTSQLIQGQMLHTVTYFSSAFMSLCWLFHPFIELFLFVSSFICGISLERCFYAAQIKQGFCTVPSDQGERASQTKGEDFFFFFFSNRTRQHINQILLPPLALRHCGGEWSKKKARLQQRAYCRLIRAFWAEGPLLPPPWEAPNSTACGVNGGPSWELWQTC